MKKFVNSIFLFCGIVLSLAAFPVFGQKTDSETIINKRPLQDFARSLKMMEIDWTKPFAIEVEGFLSKDGRLDTKKTKIVRTDGDRQMIEVAKRYIEAISDSEYFQYLSNQGIEKIKLAAAQTPAVFSASIIAEQTTPERAKTLSSGINMMASTVLMMDKNGMKKLRVDEKELLSNTKISVSGKNVSIETSLTASEFQEIVKRSLQNSQSEEKALNGN